MKSNPVQIRLGRRHSILGCWLVAAAMVAGAYPNKSIADKRLDTTTAKGLVAYALRAEVAGDAARRQALLDEAIESAPDYLPARWHSGHVFTDGSWLPLEKAQQAAAANPRRQQYEQLRETAGESLDGQLALARWCRKHGLDDEARVHWTNVVSYEPGNDEALRALGVRWFGGRLMSYSEIDAAKARMRASRVSAKEYAPRVARWERLLSAGDILSRDKALDEIRSLRNGDAIPALEDVTLGQKLTSNAKFERSMQIGLALVDALDRMPGQEATKSLLRHAATSQTSSVREAASAALKKRPPHDYVPQLLAALTSPIESTFRVATDSDGSVHYWHSLYRETAEANWIAESRNSVFQHDFGASTLILDEETGAIAEDRESDASVAAQKAAVAARSQGQFAGKASTIEQHVARANQELAAANERVFPVLRQVTGQEIGNNPRDWWDWWDRENDYASYSEGERPTYEQRYVQNERRYYREPEYTSVSARHSCFAPGTLVWTKTGLRAIETLEIGDFVLAQDTSTGELAYKVVMGRTVRPARPTVSVQCGDDNLQATRGHPIWVSGAGWKMANELQPGDVLHGVEEPVLVDAVETADTIDVYNLIVADWHNYFVGESGVLVHDNSPRQPTTAKVPGLMPE